MFQLLLFPSSPSILLSVATRPATPGSQVQCNHCCLALALDDFHLTPVIADIAKKKSSSVSHFPENGQEQRRGGDHRRVLGDVPEGLYEIFIFFPHHLLQIVYQLKLSHLIFFFFSESHLQDENIMQSMHMFDNVI